MKFAFIFTNITLSKAHNETSTVFDFTLTCELAVHVADSRQTLL